jgi:hypothetical protein
MPVDNYLFLELEDDIQAARASWLAEMFAARDQAASRPKPPKPPELHITPEKKREVRETFHLWTAQQRGTLRPSDPVQAFLDAQAEADRQAYARATNLGTAPRGMLPRTQVAHSSGLPAWTKDVTSLWFYPDTGTLCPPGDRPQSMGTRPAMWNNMPFTPPFELKLELDDAALEGILGCVIWRPGECRLLPSPDSPLPEVQ